MRTLNFVLFFLVAVLLFNCKDGVTNETSKQSEKAGGTFTMADNVSIVNLFPSFITSQVEGFVVSQIHEGLVKLNTKSLEPIPALAEKWDISTDGKTITFHLRKGIHFQDDACYEDGKGPELTSKDVKFTFETICTKAQSNYQFEIIFKDRILGANDFYDKKATSLAGFKIIDDYTFSLELINSSYSFLKILASPAASIINEQAFKKYGSNLKTGIGPFIYNSSSTAEKIILTKNPHYFEKDSSGYSLPYLDSVVLVIIPSLEDGLSLYENEKLDLVNTLPSLRVKEIVEKHIQEFVSNPPKSLLQHEAEMVSQYYVFNMKQKPFDNVKVRQAINFAIDKDKLVDNLLQGQAIGPANYGITPNTFTGYDIKQINGYTFDLARAKKLLAEAGYPGGIGFPEVRLLVNSGNSRNSSIAVEVQKQLKDHLNININFESLPNGQKHELQIYGKSDVFREAWVADYSSPEAFLSLFVGETVPATFEEPSFPNSGRYQNPAYDVLFKKGRNNPNKDSSYAYFIKAEQLLINDACIIPLWYEGSYRMLKNNVKNLHLNAMRYYDLRSVYKVK